MPPAGGRAAGVERPLIDARVASLARRCRVAIQSEPPRMIEIGPSAQDHFRRLLAQQGIPDLGVRMRVVEPGTPRADVKLEFCEPADLVGDEWAIDCEGFTLYVEAASAPFLDGAEVDYRKTPTGGALTIRAPGIKGRAPGAEAPLIERVRHVIDHEVNPELARHGGRCTLVAVESDGTVVLRFGGGCHGCGMVEVTVRDGIERTLRARIPEVTGIRDVTDHASGSAPYIRRA
jgi:Fe/S biogenesis protein NfuA